MICTDLCALREDVASYKKVVYIEITLLKLQKLDLETDGRLSSSLVRQQQQKYINKFYLIIDTRRMSFIRLHKMQNVDLSFDKLKTKKQKIKLFQHFHQKASVFIWQIK